MKRRLIIMMTTICVAFQISSRSSFLLPRVYHDRKLSIPKVEYQPVGLYQQYRTRPILNNVVIRYLFFFPLPFKSVMSFSVLWFPGVCNEDWWVNELGELREWWKKKKERWRDKKANGGRWADNLLFKNEPFVVWVPDTDWLRGMRFPGMWHGLMDASYHFSNCSGAHRNTRWQTIMQQITFRLFCLQKKMESSHLNNFLRKISFSLNNRWIIGKNSNNRTSLENNWADIKKVFGEIFNILNMKRIL